MIKKWVAILLCFTVTLSGLPITAFAESASEELVEDSTNHDIALDEESLSTADGELEYSNEIVEELTNERETNEKHFLMEDGSIMAVQYREDVHYEDEEGNLQEIDNSLKLSNTQSGTASYENTENSVDVKFFKDSDTGELIQLNKDQYQLSWEYQESTPKMKTTAVTESNSQEIIAGDFEVANVQSDVKYENVEDKVDIVYDLIGSTLKESIIVNEKKDSYNFTFNLNIENLEAKLTDDGEIELCDKETKELAFFIPAPYMFDSNEEYSSDVQYEIKEQTDNELILQIEADEQWMNAEDRAYPVTIDPIIETSVNKKAIEDTFVASKYYEASMYSWGKFLVGYENTYQTCRAYIKFNNLPKLRPGDMVVEATLNTVNMNFEPYSTTHNNMDVGVYEVQQSWDSKVLQWNNQPKFDGNPTDYQTFSTGQEGQWKTFDITRIAQKWYDGSPNNGVVVKTYNERANATNPGSTSSGYYAKAELMSVDHPDYDNNAKPYIAIRFMNSKGIEKHYTYHDQSLGQAGTGYTNDYTGMLTYEFEDLSYSGNRMPLQLTHYHDSDTKNLGYGNGWRTSLSKEIWYCGDVAEYSALLKQGYLFFIIDEDGTNIFFKKSDKQDEYFDDIGLGLKLRLESDHFILEDKDGNRSWFKGNYLVKLQDSDGNSLIISRNKNQINSVTDGAGRTTSFEYQNGLLSAIVDPAGRRTTYNYSGTNLHKITRPDGTHTNFGYNGEHLAWVRSSENGEAISYGRKDNNKGKVNSVEYFTNTTCNENTLNVDSKNSGQKMNISYRPKATIFTTSGKDDVLGTNDDISTQYSFDFDGRTTSINSFETNTGRDIGSENYSYTAKSSTEPSKNNKITYAASGGGYADNIVKNSSFEKKREWQLSSGDISYDTSQSYFGASSLKQVSDGKQIFATQSLSGYTAGTYTISAYVKTAGITGNGGAYMDITAQTSSGKNSYYISEFISGTTNTEMEDGWTRITITVEIPSDVTGIHIGLGMVNAKGTVWFDGIQVEKGEIANNVNLIENSNFRNGWEQWNNVSNRCSIKANGRHGQNAANLAGSPKEYLSVYQEVEIKGNPNDSYIASFWAKGNSVALQGKKRATLTMRIFYTDGSWRWLDKHINIAAAWDEWVYTSLAFSVMDPSNSDKIPKSIYFILNDDLNAGTLCFNSVQLIKDASESYMYDKDGNPISVKDNVTQNQTFNYNKNSQLVRDLSPGIGKFYYSYHRDRKHQMVQSDGNGLTYNYKYDEYGNNTGVRVDNNEIIPGQYYTIRVADTGMYMDVSGRGTAHGTKVLMHGGHMEDNQQWKFEEVSKNTYIISPKHAPDRWLDVMYASTSDGSKLCISQDKGRTNQKFLFVKNDDGTYNIRPMHSPDKNLDVDKNDDSNLQIWSISDTSLNQKFIVSPIGSSSNSIKTRSASSANEIVSGEDYIVQVSDTGKAMDVYKASTEHNTAVTMYDYQGGPNQVWKFEKVPNYDDVFTLSPEHATDKQLGVKDNSNANKATLCISKEKGLESQKFRFVKNNDGTYNIRPLHAPTKSLDVAKENNITLQLWDTSSGSSNQKFIITPAKAKSTGEYISTSAEYGTNGNYLTKQYDQRGFATTYTYDENRDVLTSTYNAKGQGSTYEYDAGDRLTKSTTKKDGRDVSIQYGIDGNSNISSIQRNGMSYNFEYDSWGALTAVKAGNVPLVSKSYNTNDGKPNKVTYGNGAVIEPIYDGIDRIIGEKRNGVDQYTWTYDGNGNVVNHVDLVNNIKYNYHYDTLGRLVRSKSSDGFESYVTYNNKDQLTKSVNSILGDSKTTLLTYDNYARLSGESSQNGGKITYKYDALNRLNNQIYEKDNLKLERVSKSYVAGSKAGSTTELLENYAYLVNNKSHLELSYTYDEIGNITAVKQGNQLLADYVYDEFNQLSRENNAQLNKTIVYKYDDGGNLTLKQEYAYTTGELGKPETAIDYGYNDSNWKDKLTNYNGQEITYDEIGNPLIYRDGLSFTWQNGTELASSSKDGKNNTYKYDSEGIRIEKSVDGVKTKYFLNDTAIIREDRDGDSPIWFMYDGNGRHTGFEYNGKTYMYLLNIQGDVVEILDESGASVVQYTYDSWGKVVSTKGSLADIIGERNPIRYRGYYYDTETGLYYLNSRYYDPTVGRFINPDDYSVILDSEDNPADFNLYAYCVNNPVNYSDPTGDVAVSSIIGGVVGAIAGAVLAKILADSLGLKGWKRGLFIAGVTVAGAALGAFLGPYVAKLSSKAAVAIKSKLSSAAKVVKTGGKKVITKGKSVASKVKRSVKKVGRKSIKSYCFVAGTLVEAQDGYIPIENIQIGDYVYAEDPETGEKGLRQVVQTFVNEVDELVHINVNGEKISATPGHPFYSPEKGWVDAVKLRAGDKLLLRSGEIVIVEQVQHEILESPVLVYNFEVEGLHTYYVTSSSILVHNKGCSLNKLSNSYVKKNLKLNAHAIKKEYLGSRAKIAYFDLAVDKTTGIIYIINKAGKIIHETYYKTK